MTEDDLISLIANLADRPAADVIIGIGDYAAVVDVPHGKSLVSCTDTLVSGVHFPAGTPAFSVGFKSLAVNLSDMAAMAATPRWAQLSLTLPAIDEEWIEGFFAGFLALADRYNVALIGGDTCAGPLSITVQLLGVADGNTILRRGAASVGDLIAVSGWLGDAALALSLIKRAETVDPDLLKKLDEPEPRVELGQKLAGIASSCIDISDGLMLDLERLLQRSGYGARLEIVKLPASDFLAGLTEDERWEFQLGGGDDYELCFSVPPGRLPQLEETISTVEVPVNIIGEVTASPGISCYDAVGTAVQLKSTGFQHFKYSDESGIESS